MGRLTKSKLVNGIPVCYLQNNSGLGDTVWYWDKDRHPLEEAPFEGYISGYEIASHNSACIIITPKRDFASECFIAVEISCLLRILEKLFSTLKKKLKLH